MTRGVVVARRRRLEYGKGWCGEFMMLAPLLSTTKKNRPGAAPSLWRAESRAAGQARKIGALRTGRLGLLVWELSCSAT